MHLPAGSSRLLYALVALILDVCVSNVLGKELTPSNFAAETAGKQVFIKFYAPWCGHCKAMKPAWDTLMGEYASHQHTGVYTVDCTDEGGKQLCEKHAIGGFPTIKWGNPDNLEAYTGGREYEELKEFAQQNLGPVCNHKNLEMCDEETQQLLRSFLSKPLEELKSMLARDEVSSKSLQRRLDKMVNQMGDKEKELEGLMAEEEEQRKLIQRKRTEMENTKGKYSARDVKAIQKKEQDAKNREKDLLAKGEKLKAQRTNVDAEAEGLRKKIKQLGVKHLRAIVSMMSSRTDL